MKEQLRDYGSAEQFREQLSPPDSLLISSCLYLDIMTYLTDDICVKLDPSQHGCLSGSAVRPFLDDRLMEFGSSRLSSSEGAEWSVGKYILGRKLSKPCFQGIFGAAQAGRCLIARVQKRFAGVGARVDAFESNELLNVPYLRHLWNRHQNKIQDHSAHSCGECVCSGNGNESSGTNLKLRVGDRNNAFTKA